MEAGVAAAVDQIVGDNHPTDGRDRRRQKGEPADKVIVQPQRAERADNTVNHRQRAAGKAGHVGKAQTRRIERVVVGCPDVQAENDNGGQQ